MAEEQAFLRETAEEKYRRTHNYNLIAGAYYDQNKERDFVNAREKLGTMQGRAQQYRLPPSIRYGQGNDYNIINQQVRGSTDVLSVFAHSSLSVNVRTATRLLRETLFWRGMPASPTPGNFGVLRMLDHLHHFACKLFAGNRMGVGGVAFVAMKGY